MMLSHLTILRHCPSLCYHTVIFYQFILISNWFNISYFFRTLILVCLSIYRHHTLCCQTCSFCHQNFCWTSPLVTKIHTTVARVTPFVLLFNELRDRAAEMTGPGRNKWNTAPPTSLSLQITSWQNVRSVKTINNATKTRSKYHNAPASLRLSSFREILSHTV